MCVGSSRKESGLREPYCSTDGPELMHTPHKSLLNQWRAKNDTWQKKSKWSYSFLFIHFFLFLNHFLVFLWEAFIWCPLLAKSGTNESLCRPWQRGQEVDRTGRESVGLEITHVFVGQICPISQLFHSVNEPIWKWSKAFWDGLKCHTYHWGWR